jgi:hypothetical protein
MKRSLCTWTITENELICVEFTAEDVSWFREVMHATPIPSDGCTFDLLHKLWFHHLIEHNTCPEAHVVST